MRGISVALFLLVLVCVCSVSGFAQKRKVVGRVCGDPTTACSTRQDFQAFELPFLYGKNSGISQSQLFYAVILRSVKLKSDQSDCDKAISEPDRTETQALFPHNMVFVMRCWESGQGSYSNVADGVSFMGVYAGSNQADANAFLAKVRATGKFNGAVVRRMRVLINGT